MRLSKLAEILNAPWSGTEDPDITGAAGIREAVAGQITFVTGPRHLQDLESSRASAALVPPEAPQLALPVLRVKNPKLAFARVLELLYVKPYAATGISGKAVVGQGVSIGSDCSIHPFAVLGDRVRIGSRVTIHAGSVIGEDSVIDEDTVIHANVSIGHKVTIGKRVIVYPGSVIGGDGFGFVTEAGRHHKIPQVGGVIIEDDVEIGSCCTIDRATMGNTLIKRGTKLDSQVHVAHNVTIGENCIMAGQTGIAGSVTIGNGVVFGGAVAVADHLTIGDGVMAGGGSAVTQDVEAGQIIAGMNAMPIRDWLKVQAVLPRLPELKKRILELEKQIQELKQKS